MLKKIEKNWKAYLVCFMIGIAFAVVVKSCI